LLSNTKYYYLPNHLTHQIQPLLVSSSNRIQQRSPILVHCTHPYPSFVDAKEVTDEFTEIDSTLSGKVKSQLIAIPKKLERQL
jgi:hypothetical protein